MGMMHSWGLNSTIVAQIFNFVILLLFLTLPVIILVYLFRLLRHYRSLDSRIRKLEEILMEKGKPPRH